MMLTALKPAEDGEVHIVRVADRHGRGGEGELHRLDQTFSIAVAPFEVIALRLSQKDGQWEADLCDTIERVE
jgi:hypothetical protein